MQSIWEMQIPVVQRETSNLSRCTPALQRTWQRCGDATCDQKIASKAQADVMAGSRSWKITSSVSLLASRVALRRPLLVTISCDNSSSSGMRCSIKSLPTSSGWAILWAVIKKCALYKIRHQCYGRCFYPAVHHPGILPGLGACCFPLPSCLLPCSSTAPHRNSEKVYQAAARPKSDCLRQTRKVIPRLNCQRTKGLSPDSCVQVPRLTLSIVYVSLVQSAEDR